MRDDPEESYRRGVDGIRDEFSADQRTPDGHSGWVFWLFLSFVAAMFAAFLLLR